jgi:UDP-glucose 4-epimerase
MKNKILVLGGTGFIGLNLVKRLIENGESEITIVDNYFRGKNDSELSDILNSGKVKLHELDLTEPNSYEAIGKEYEYVYLMASIVGVGYTEQIPHQVIKVNSSIILNALEWMAKSNSKKILYSSTSECYAGTIEKFGYKIPTDENVPLSISNIRNPRFTYAITKIFGESACINYARKYGFKSVIVRYHNVYGPRMGFMHVIPQVIIRFLNGENPFKIIGYNQTRAFNFIDDAVEGTILAMKYDKSSEEIFHIGDMDSEISVEKLVKYIGMLLKFNGAYEYSSAPSGSVSRRCPDITKAKRELSYFPRTSWEEGVKYTVEWYQEYIKSEKPIFE